MNLIQQKTIPECSEFLAVKVGVDVYKKGAILEHHDAERLTDGLFRANTAGLNGGSNTRHMTKSELLDDYDYFLFVESK